MDTPPAEQPQVIPPQPLPEVWTAGGAQMPDGTPAVVVQISTPGGVSFHFLDREMALNVASMLRKQAQSGPTLVVPPSGLAVVR